MHLMVNQNIEDFNKKLKKPGLKFNIRRFCTNVNKTNIKESSKTGRKKILLQAFILINK